jgi:predicted Zn finger-like uncharacterized protein
MSSEKPDKRVVGCPACKRHYRIARSATEKPGARLRCTGCGHVFRLTPAAPAPPAPLKLEKGPRILVASDGGELRSIVEEVLQRDGYAYRSVQEGDEAWRQIGAWEPQAAVLDVGLPGMPVFEICDKVRQDARCSRMGIVLLASVYERTRYKRSPTSLYGADDYIEKHHLRDSLTVKIARLIPGKGFSPAAGGGQYPPPVREEAVSENKVFPSQEEVEKEEKTLVQEERYGSVEVSGGITGVRSAHLKRFARIIMADIALYNQEQVERGVREGNLQEVLESEIEEGRRLFRTRLKSSSGEGMELYTQAIEEFVARQKVRFTSSGQPGEGGI